MTSDVDVVPWVSYNIMLVTGVLSLKLNYFYSNFKINLFKFTLAMMKEDFNCTLNIFLFLCENPTDTHSGDYVSLERTKVHTLSRVSEAGEPGAS